MAEDEKPTAAFVPLKSLGKAAVDPAAAVAEIRQIYFKTSKRTIDNDFAHAIELLKSLPDEEARAKAHVYMEGLAEMRREWGARIEKGASRKAKGEARRPKRDRS